MEINSEACVLKIYIGSTDQVNQTPLYVFLVFQAKRKGIAGTTVTKEIVSFGASSIIHSYKFWEISDKVSLVVEMVDKKKLRNYYGNVRPQLENMKLRMFDYYGQN